MYVKCSVWLLFWSRPVQSAITQSSLSQPVSLDWHGPVQYSPLDPVQSGLRCHTVVRPAGHDVSSPADAAERAVGVHTASVDTRVVHGDAALTLVYVCETHTHTHRLV